MAQAGRKLLASVPRTVVRSRRMVQLGDLTVPERVEVVVEGDPDAIPGQRAPSMTFVFEVRDGVAGCVGWNVAALPGSHFIRPDEVSALFDIDGLGRAAFLQHALVVDGGGFVLRADLPTRDESQAVRDAIERGHTSAREQLAAVARAYLNPANRTAPTVAVLSQFGSRTTANRRIRDARAAGLIPPAGATDEALDTAWQRLLADASDSGARAHGVPIEEMAARLGFPADANTTSAGIDPPAHSKETDR